MSKRASESKADRAGFSRVLLPCAGPVRPEIFACHFPPSLTPRGSFRAGLIFESLFDTWRLGKPAEKWRQGLSPAATRRPRGANAHRDSDQGAERRRRLLHFAPGFALLPVRQTMDLARETRAHEKGEIPRHEA